VFAFGHNLALSRGLQPTDGTIPFQVLISALTCPDSMVWKPDFTYSRKFSRWAFAEIHIEPGSCSLAPCHIGREPARADPWFSMDGRMDGPDRMTGGSQVQMEG
jgi:hypothetical protein